ncbi:hypothetical protein ACOMHN_064994 [Nucella lapillus]
MSEESSGPQSLPSDLGPEICVVLCDDNDLDGCCEDLYTYQDPETDLPPKHKDEDEEEEEEEVEEEEEEEDCPDYSMLPVTVDEESRIGGSGACGRQNSGKRRSGGEPHPGGSQQCPRHSASFGVTAEEEDDQEEELLFPGFVGKTCYHFHQRHWLRFPCLRLITWPYPFCADK